MTKVKICGLTTLEDARFVAGAGADFLGFIQYEGSPRYIPSEKAREIIDWIHGPEAVGVFVNESAEVMNAAAEQAGFSMLQLCGTEPPAVCRELSLPVIKVIPVVHDASSEQIRWLMTPYEGIVDFFLLDTHKTSLFGGTGESFNWRLARDLAMDFPIFLAGGINAANVGEAISTMRPYAVDLSSSMESEPGVKDFDRLTHFFDVFNEVTDRVHHS